MEATESNVTVMNDDNLPRVVAQTVLICIFTVVGLFGNCLIIVCILRNKDIRSTPYSLMMVNFSFVNIIDCVVNLTFIISTTLAQSWTFDRGVCQFHAFALQVVNIEIILGLMIIAFERLFAIKGTMNDSNSLSTWKTVLLIVFTWCHCLAFTVPIVAGVIPSTFYQSKYFCAVDRNVSLLYIIFLCVLCFALPFVVTLTVYTFVLRLYFVDKKRSKVNCQQSGKFYSDVINIELTQFKITKECHQSRFTFSILILWLCLHCPFLIANIYEEVRNSKEVNDDQEMNYYYLPDAVDLIFSWARFSFPAAVVIINLCRKELRNGLKRFLSCRRNNSVVDLNSASILRQSEKKSKNRLQLNAFKLREKYSGNSLDNPSFQVPVLFATSNGIHMQKLKNELPMHGGNETEIHFMNSSFVQCRDFRIHEAEKCDVLGSHSDLIQVEDDTSDYDSSCDIDQFSVSHPISSKMLKQSRTEMLHVEARNRSMSNPEVGGIKLTNVKPSAPCALLGDVDGRSVMPGDSGIDISSTGVNSMSRKSRDATMQSNCVPEVEILTELSLPSVVNSISSVVLAQAMDAASRKDVRLSDNSVKPDEETHGNGEFIDNEVDCKSVSDILAESKEGCDVKYDQLLTEHDTGISKSTQSKSLGLVTNLKHGPKNEILSIEDNLSLTRPSRLKPIDFVPSQRAKISKLSRLRRNNEQRNLSKIDSDSSMCYKPTTFSKDTKCITIDKHSKHTKKLKPIGAKLDKTSGINSLQSSTIEFGGVPAMGHVD